MTELERTVRAIEAELAALQTSDTREAAALLARLGSNLAAIGQRARGVESIRRSVALFEDLKDRRGLADSLNRLAALTQDPDEARVVLHRALQTARDAGDRSAEATSLNNLAIRDEVEGNLDTSLAYYAESIGLLRVLDDLGKLGSTLNNMGVLLAKRGEHDQARNAWREAMVLLVRTDSSTLASTYNNLGRFLERGGDPGAAVTHYLDSIAIQERLGDVGELSIMLGNLAHAYTALGQHDEAIRALERRLGLHERADDKRGAAETLHQLGEAGRGITPEIDAYYARAIDAFHELGDPEEVALVEMDRALAWSRASEHAKAIAMGEHALKLRLEMMSDVETAAAMDNLGLIYSAAGDRTKAIELMERSLTLTEKIDDKEGMLIVLCNLADEYALSDRELAAIECYRRALPLAEKADDRETLVKVLDELGALHASLADHGPAVSFTRRALAIYERRQENAAVDRMRTRLDQLERRQQN